MAGEYRLKQRLWLHRLSLSLDNLYRQQNKMIQECLACTYAVGAVGCSHPDKAEIHQERERKAYSEEKQLDGS
jgi:hypothetical protein